MEEIQQIKGWQTSTQTDFYKRIQNKNSMLQCLRQVKATKYQNLAPLRIIKKTKINKQELSIKRDNYPVQLPYEVQEKTQKIWKQKNVQITEKQTWRQKKTYDKNIISIQKQNNRFLVNKNVRQRANLYSLQRQNTFSKQFYVPLMNKQKHFIETKKIKRQKENFDNKELVFCSTMMQKQRSQRIQSIYYKGKQKNIKNRIFFALTCERLQKLNRNDSQMTKQFVLEAYKNQQIELKKKSLQASNSINNSKDKHRVKVKTKYKKLKKKQHPFFSGSGNDLKYDILTNQNDNLKYFPTIFKIDRSGEKKQEQKRQTVYVNKGKYTDSTIKKLNKRNSSQYLFKSANSRLIYIKKGNQTGCVIQFNDNKLCATDQKGSSTREKTTHQHNKLILR